jgi:RecB family endonuclease NucS
MTTEVRLSPPGTVGAEAVVDSVLGQEAAEEGETARASFALEYQLRDFIAQNLSTIMVEGRHLQLYVDPAGRDGIEFPLSVGPIDIVAVDDSGGFVVFELKRAHSPDHAIGQLTRYMGWVRQTIGKGRDVRGIIVAKDIGNNLRYAASVVPNVSLFEYEVEFHLKPAQQLPGASGTEVRTA